MVWRRTLSGCRRLGHWTSPFCLHRKRKIPALSLHLRLEQEGGSVLTRMHSVSTPAVLIPWYWTCSNQIWRKKCSLSSHLFCCVHLQPEQKVRVSQIGSVLPHEKRVSSFVLDLGALSDSYAAIHIGRVAGLLPFSPVSPLTFFGEETFFFFCPSVPLCKGALPWPLLSSKLQDLVFAIHCSHGLLVLVSLSLVMYSSCGQRLISGKGGTECK